MLENLEQANFGRNELSLQQESKLDEISRVVAEGKEFGVGIHNVQ